MWNMIKRAAWLAAPVVGLTFLIGSENVREQIAIQAEGICNKFLNSADLPAFFETRKFREYSESEKFLRHIRDYGEPPVLFYRQDFKVDETRFSISGSFAKTVSLSYSPNTAVECLIDPTYVEKELGLN